MKIKLDDVVLNLSDVNTFINNPLARRRLLDQTQPLGVVNYTYKDLACSVDSSNINGLYHIIRYDTIRYDSGYLTCSKKLTGSQLSLPHGTNKKLECETKNKMMSITFCYHKNC